MEGTQIALWWVAGGREKPKCAAWLMQLQQRRHNLLKEFVPLAGFH